MWWFVLNCAESVEHPPIAQAGCASVKQINIDSTTKNLREMIDDWLTSNSFVKGHDALLSVTDLHACLLDPVFKMDRSHVENFLTDLFIDKKDIVEMLTSIAHEAAPPIAQQVEALPCEQFCLQALKEAFGPIQTFILKLAGILDESGKTISGKEKDLMTFHARRSHLFKVFNQINDIQSVLPSETILAFGDHVNTQSDLTAILSSASISTINGDGVNYKSIGEELRNAGLGGLVFKTGSNDFGVKDLERTYGWFISKGDKVKAFLDIMEIGIQPKENGRKFFIFMEDMYIFQKLQELAAVHNCVGLFIYNVEAKKQADVLKQLPYDIQMYWAERYASYLWGCLLPNIQETALRQWQSTVRLKALEEENARLRTQLEKLEKSTSESKEALVKEALVVKWLTEVEHSEAATFGDESASPCSFSSRHNQVKRSLTPELLDQDELSSESPGPEHNTQSSDLSDETPEGQKNLQLRASDSLILGSSPPHSLMHSVSNSYGQPEKIKNASSSTLSPFSKTDDDVENNSSEEDPL